MKHLANKSVLVKYLISYLSMALALCLMFGSVYFYTSVTELNQTITQTQLERLSAASDDITRQLKIVEEIRLIIRTSLAFQKFYRSINPIKEKELIEKIQTFENYSPSIREYFVYFPDEDAVYSSSAKYSFSQFAPFYFGSQCNVSDVKGIILGGTGMDCFSTGLLSAGGNPLLVMKLTIGYGSSRTNALLLFSFDHDLLDSRIRSLYHLPEQYDILIGGQPLFGTGRVQESEALSGLSEDGRVTCIVPQSATGISEHQSAFRRGLLIASLLILIVAVTVAVLMARQNYKPIKKLAEKVDSPNLPHRNEIETIEQAITNVVTDHRDSLNQVNALAAQVSEINEALKRSLLLLLLNGECDEVILNHLDNLGIHFPHPSFNTAWIPFCNQMKSPQLLRVFQSMNGNRCRLHWLQMPKEWGWGIIFNYEDDQQIDEFVEAVSRIENSPFTIRVGKKCTSLAKIGNSFAYAVMHYDENEESNAVFQWKAEELKELKNLIMTGDEDAAVEKLFRMLDPLERTCPTRLIQRFLYRDLAYKIVQMAKDMRREVPNMFLQELTKTVNLDDCREYIRLLTTHLCSQYQQETESDESKAIIKYIDEHATDYDICMENVCSACGTLPNQVNQILRDTMGITFREYLIKLRISRAMILLQAGTPIGEVAQAVGYADSSYFIKLFRKNTGVTPGQYQTGNQKAGD